MGGGGGAGGCRYSAAFGSSTISLVSGMVVRFLGGSGTGTGAETGAGTGMTEEGAERYPAVRGSLLVMVTMETAGITGGEMSD